MIDTVESLQEQIVRATKLKKRRSHLQARLKSLMSQRIAGAIASNGYPVVIQMTHKSKAEKLHDQLRREAAQQAAQDYAARVAVYDLESWAKHFDEPLIYDEPIPDADKTHLWPLLLLLEVLAILVIFRYFGLL